MDAYLMALECAQSLWLCGLPAQSLLQLNHALAVDLAEEVSILGEWPLPYTAKLWIIEQAGEGEFLGNPVRHYQHLASRMSGHNSELRTLRAWVCFHLCERALCKQAYPRDEKQIVQEGLEIPTWNAVMTGLSRLGKPQEVLICESL